MTGLPADERRARWTRRRFPIGSATTLAAPRVGAGVVVEETSDGGGYIVPDLAHRSFRSLTEGASA